MPSSIDTPLMTSISDDKSETSSRSRDEPVVWYAFYSESAGREYYYEPKSKTATWIMPDEYNPHPTSSKTDDHDESQEMLPPKIRRVKFRANDKSAPNAERSRSHGGGSRAGSKTARRDTDAKKGAQAVPCKVLPLAITAVAAYFAYFYVHGSDSLQMLQTSVNIHVDRVPEKEMIRKDTGTKIVSPGAKVADDTTAITAISPSTQSNEKVEKTVKVPPQVKITMQLPSKSETQTRGVEEREEEIALKAEKEINNYLVKSEHVEGGDVERVTPPTKCAVPFAYVFSRDCRGISAEMPVFDTEMATFYWLE